MITANENKQLFLDMVAVLLACLSIFSSLSCSVASEFCLICKPRLLLMVSSDLNHQLQLSCSALYVFDSLSNQYLLGTRAIYCGMFW